jgi:UDP-2,3-diacylglucosamine hydrolase
MGDLFDFWFAWEHAMPRTGFRVLAALADLRDSGVPVLWIGGNHDCWGGETLALETGATYTLEPWRGRIGSWDTLLAHGDGLRVKEDAPYRRLRTVLRHPW